MALIVAAGRGVRAGGGLPKQYRMIGDEPVLRHTLRAFLAHPGIGAIVTVIHPDDDALYTMASDGLDTSGRLKSAVHGGAERQDSVRAGLEALAALDPDGAVLVHDAVRPFASAALITRVLDALSTHQGAIAATRITDTLKRGGPEGLIAATIDRAGLWAAQTPQGFRLATLLAAHRAAAESGRRDFTDDAALLEWHGHQVALVPGETGNFKITQPEDFARAGQALGPCAAPEWRTGVGYDVHAFTDGASVALGGVVIPHDRGILAHSDGDVALHALTDALLGALGDGDIGTHFPPSDARWRGVSSGRFLAHAASLVRAKGGTIAHLDVTIIAEEPRVGRYRPAMRAAIATAAGIDEARVSIKATTSEQLGFTGRREGLAALASATITLPGQGGLR